MSTPVAFVLDDSAALALQLRRVLEALGYEVYTLDPARLVLPLTPAPALICIELLGLESNGFKLLRQLAAVHECPQLLMTATGRVTDLHWGLRAGATAVLRRPCTLAQLAPWAPLLAQSA